MTEGKFDNKSHEELYDMIASAQPSRFSDAAEVLEQASTDIDAIGEEFKAHVARVKWEGDGAEAFRTWGTEMVTQTFKLAQYTGGISTWIASVGDGLRKAQNRMPPLQCYVDPVKDAEARSKTGTTHREAVHAVETADHHMATAYDELQKLTAPQFPLLPGVLQPGRDAYERPQGVPPSGMKAVGGGSFAHTNALPISTGQHGGAESASAHLSHHGGSESARHLVDAGQHGHEPVSTTVDSTVTAPSPDTTQHIVPDHAGQSHAPSGGSGPMVPSPITSGMPSTVRGPEKFAPGRVSGVPGESVNSSQPRTVRRLGPNDGVVGGTPADRPSRPTGPRVPRGTVVGEERAPAGRTPVARAPMGAGGYGGGAGQPGSAAYSPGRRQTTSELGGSSAARRERRSEFTQGGSGLVRGNQGVGAVPRPGTAPPGKNGRRAGARPDYLTEDEETWTQGRHDTVPPVID